MTQLDLIRANREAIKAIVSKYGCSNPRIFGSVAQGKETAKSDIDILIDTGDDTNLFDLGGMYSELAQLLSADIDLVTSTQVPEDAIDQVIGRAIPV